MKRTKIISLMLCLALAATGCNRVAKTPAVSETSASSSSETTSQTEPAESDSDAEPEETEATETMWSEMTQTDKGSHQVFVEDLERVVITDKSDEHISRYPKLIVDGKEATEINSSLHSHIQKNYPMKKNDADGSVEGYHVSYEWGVRGNTVSILLIVHVMNVPNDDYYYLYEAFNYDLDTLKQLEGSEVAKRFGLNDEQFFAKAGNLYAHYWERQLGGDSDESKAVLNKNIKAISYKNVTPFITPGGYPGAVCTITVPDRNNKQVVCFNMVNMYTVNPR